MPIEEENGYFSVFFTAMKEETDYWQHIGEPGYILDTVLTVWDCWKVKLVSN